MSSSETIDDIILQKIEHHASLKEKWNQLENLDIALTGSRISRWFGSTYLIVKLILTIFIGILFLVLGLTLIINPGLVLSDEELKEELIAESKQSYMDTAKETLEQSITLMLEGKSNITVEQFLHNLDEGFEKAIEKELPEAFREVGILFMLISLVFFYISRLTSKMKKRNVKTSSAEALTQELILDFKSALETSEEELAQLKNYKKSLSAEITTDDSTNPE